ncbi:MAG TPA: hypothetical protein VF572_04995 [Candidatus Saccharimonadales bacterium]
MKSRTLVTIGASASALAVTATLAGFGASPASAITTKEAVKVAYARCGNTYVIQNEKHSKLLLDGVVYGTFVVFTKRFDDLSATTCNVIVPADKIKGKRHTLYQQGELLRSDGKIEEFAHKGVRYSGTFTSHTHFEFGTDVHIAAQSTVPGTKERAKSGVLVIENTD